MTTSALARLKAAIGLDDDKELGRLMQLGEQAVIDEFEQDRESEGIDPCFMVANQRAMKDERLEMLMFGIRRSSLTIYGHCSAAWVS